MASYAQSPFLQTTLQSLTQLQSLGVHGLLQSSDALVSEFRAQLQSSSQSMLPSYTNTLPSGTETGTAVALDLGGSTLRVAIVRLGKPADLHRTGKESLEGRLAVLERRRSWGVSDSVKKLPAREFFDWIAERIADILKTAGTYEGRSMSLGVTWSFPVEPTSVCSGKVQKMGKGYEQWLSIAGTDLKSHFDAAFRRKGLSLSVGALMNDTEATLLSHAYTNPETRISLIWGTGINAAVHLPLEFISQRKLGQRPNEWTSATKAVVINTEVSMFGASIFPISEADSILDSNSAHPGFQPLEQLTSGRYLGEIFRLVMLSAARQGELFRGHVPEAMEVVFSFDTASMNAIERGDDALTLKTLKEKYRFRYAPSSQDMAGLRDVARALSARAATYVAVTLFSLYRLQRDTAQPEYSPALPTILGDTTPTVAIAYCGAVAEKHHTALVRCQEALDMLVRFEQTTFPRRKLVLEGAEDSGLLGAAVGAILHRGMPIITPKL